MVDRINLILKVKNLTARQFAEEIGIQPSGMSHILSGRNNPSLDFVMKVIRRFPEIDINWLMFGKGEMYDSSHRYMGNSATQMAPVAHSTVEEPERPANSIASDVSADYAEPPRVNTAAANVQEVASGYGEPDLFSGLSVPVQPAAPQRTTASSPQPVQPPEPVSEPEIRQVAENRADLAEQDSDSKETNLMKKKKIVKVVILYDDYSFSEYYPEKSF